MVDGIDNPYRSDLSAGDMFVGREELVAELTGAVVRGRNAIRAVMGGRGIGKTSLARRIERELGGRALTVITSGSVQTVAGDLADALGADLDAGRPVAALSAAVGRHLRAASPSSSTKSKASCRTLKDWPSSVIS